MMAMRNSLSLIKTHTLSTQVQKTINYTRARSLSRALQSNRPASKPGLFGIDQLQTPDGFHLLRDSALDKAHKIVNQIVELDKDNNNENVVALFDELSNCLCKVADLAEFIRVAHPQDSYRSSAEQASVAISNLVERLNTDTRLYDALRSAEFQNDLDRRVAKLFMSDFEQCAIHLNDDKRSQVLQLNESILKLSTIFAANASQARCVGSNQLPDDIAHLISNPMINTSSFLSRNTQKKILITSLHADSDNERVREIAYKLYLAYDENQDNVLRNLLLCRQRLAELCGFESYAHRAIKGGIADTPEMVGEFLGSLNDRLKDLANKDYEQMLDLKYRHRPTNKTGVARRVLNAWDVPYYSANFKRGIYNENVLQCLPYFSIDTCLHGLNMIFQQLYGVKMKAEKCNPGELWHNDVIKFSIIDQHNGSKELLGNIYCDLFERQLKLNQDCHHTIRGGCHLADGSYQLPIVVLVMNLCKPAGGSTPALLSPSQVDNLFHEMGHAMHSMLARTKYQHITGTRCSTDLAEVPSILMEFFASDPRVVGNFARHYATGDQMPSDLLHCWLKSKKIFQASETQLQVFYAALDQAFHSGNIAKTLLDTPKGPGSTKSGATCDLLARVQRQYYGAIDYVPETAWHLRFSHLIGYGAKYYAYLVSRAVATAIWTQLFAAQPLSRAAGDRFKNSVLAHGGGKPAIEIVEDVLDTRVDADFIARYVMASFGEPRIKAN